MGVSMRSRKWIWVSTASVLITTSLIGCINEPIQTTVTQNQPAQVEANRKPKQNSTTMTEEQAIDLVQKKIPKNGVNYKYRVIGPKNNEFTVHVFEDMGTHTATYDYFTVDIQTRKITSEFGH